jgi:hypothetical protein
LTVISSFLQPHQAGSADCLGSLLLFVAPTSLRGAILMDLLGTDPGSEAILQLQPTHPASRAFDKSDVHQRVSNKELVSRQRFKRSWRGASPYTS